MIARAICPTLCLVAAVVLAGCAGPGGEQEAAPSTGSETGSANPICAALDGFEASLDALEDSESIEEYKANYEQVREDFQAVKAADSGENQDALNAFEEAMNEFQESLSSFDDGGLISGMLDLATDAAELAVAGERLDEAIDC